MSDKSIFTGEQKRLGLVVQNLVFFQCCCSMLSLGTMVRIPLGLFCHSMVVTCMRDSPPPCPPRLLWEILWAVSSPWGWRMSWGKGGGRGGEQHCCCARGFFSWGRAVNVTAHRAAALQGSSELVFCREHIPFYLQSEFAVPSDTAHPAADCQIAVSHCQAGISRLCCSGKVTGKRGYI